VGSHPDPRGRKRLRVDGAVGVDARLRPRGREQAEVLTTTCAKVG
jgi:hypothetical protein